MGKSTASILNNVDIDILYFSGYFTTALGKEVLTFTYICDFLFFLDILVNLRIAVVTPYGNMI